MTRCGTCYQEVERVKRGERWIALNPDKTLHRCCGTEGVHVFTTSSHMCMCGQKQSSEQTRGVADAAAGVSGSVADPTFEGPPMRQR